MKVLDVHCRVPHCLANKGQRCVNQYGMETKQPHAIRYNDLSFLKWQGEQDKKGKK